jgi:hypothetical protein
VIQRAVEDALVSARPVLLGRLATPSGLSHALFADRANAQAGESVERLLENDDFLRIVLPRIEHSLELAGFRCEDLPAPQVPVRRAVTWADVSTVLRTFITVSPVQTIESDGTPIAHPSYSFRVCTGDAAQEVARSDPSLASAVFTIAHELTALVGDILEEARAEPGYRSLHTDSARTSFLRNEVEARLEFDSAVKSQACEVFDRYEQDFDVVISDCSK